MKVFLVAVLMSMLASLVIAPLLLAQTQASIPTVPSVVAPPKAVEPSGTGTNLAQWIMLGAALLGAFLKRKNDPDADTLAWRTVFDVAVTGGATYATMDLASELGFLQTYMAAVTKKPLTLGVVAFLVSILAGAGVVKLIQVFMDNILAKAKPTA